MNRVTQNILNIKKWMDKVNQTILIGEIKPYAGSNEPTGWLKCDGRAVSRTDYSALFNVIGTTYGSGDESTTFNLPDLRGRFPLGTGEGTATGHTNHTLGQMGGNENLIVPSHDHSIPGYWSTGSGSSTAYMTSGNRSRESRRTGSSGSSATGANMPPYIGLNFIIYVGDNSLSS